MKNRSATVSAPDVLFPRGAVSGGVWESGQRVVFGAERQVAGSECVVEVHAVQLADGTVHSARVNIRGADYDVREGGLTDAQWQDFAALAPVIAAELAAWAAP